MENRSFRSSKSFVRPFFLADRKISNIKADLIFVDVSDIWFGQDLVRNDPMLRNDPKVMALQLVPDAALNQVCAEKTAGLISHPTVAALGMLQTPRSQSERQESHRLLRNKLGKHGCQLINAQTPLPVSLK